MIIKQNNKKQKKQIKKKNEWVCPNPLSGHVYIQI